MLPHNRHHDTPIYDDLPNQLYLAPEYERFGSEVFRHFGAPTVNWRELLVPELVRLSELARPPVELIRQALMKIGMTIATKGMDEKLRKALEHLRGAKFLPFKTSDNVLEYKGLEEDFAILDHTRFGSAFEGRSVLLDFSLKEWQVLDSFFRHFKLDDRYLSVAVTEHTETSEEGLENEDLTLTLRAQAYALYCCCIEALEDIMQEQDIYPVSWIPRTPRLELPVEVREQQSGREATLNDHGAYGSSEEENSEDTVRETVEGDGGENSDINPPDAVPDSGILLRFLFGASNARPGARYDSTEKCDPASPDTPPADDDPHSMSKGRGRHKVRPTDMMVTGIAGEVHVYETLQELIPNFNIDIWQSRNRRVANVLKEYQDVKNWAFPESTDLVCTDDTGKLTQILRGECQGGFPELHGGDPTIAQPINYFIEVKTTKNQANTQFCVTKNQYRLMEEYQIRPDQRPTNIYVIFRVFKCRSAEDIGIRIYVDPWNLRDTELNFKPQGSLWVTPVFRRRGRSRSRSVLEEQKAGVVG
ncbi:uncharacterized protein BDZ99DRAFT_451599 [Mytilinidion resinicola]|uniref:Protein NO VEIN C-terminal domain-containing protein n=1 Tax=Mytilinidion resinicola TaxID=574789 RepID=A0A6A6Y7F0_9PEZI|nr:uncharacterized protein BDZ99DRAFT_451599 [Mytilinidion resinicola]KAF2804529.1 hypothetical protein BDZ99DRAFT_451599 [Mytilinidion resinicola]